MTNRKPKIKITDKKGRILLSVIETSGKDRWIFHRYTDMSVEEKKLLSALFEKMCRSDSEATLLDDGKKKAIDGNIDDFLSFKDSPEFCG